VHVDAYRLGGIAELDDLDLDTSLDDAVTVVEWGEGVAEDGARRLLLEVSAENEVALRFYATAGFAEIDRRRRYYRDGSDALVLGRSLM